MTELYGVGPVVAALLIGHRGDMARFAKKDHFASYNATAPTFVRLWAIDISSTQGTRSTFQVDSHAIGRDVPRICGRNHPRNSTSRRSC